MASTTHRRKFLITLPAILAVDPALLGNGENPIKTAVIGHTGRGDYGHGLDGIFQNRPGIKLVAIADPDEKGRVQMQQRLGAPNAYADYREMLEKERPK